MNDVIRLAMEQATELYGHNGTLFNACGFSHRIMKIAGVTGVLDGRLVRVLLAGRMDVEPQPDGSMYRLVAAKAKIEGEKP
jgi:hypothetical protein